MPVSGDRVTNEFILVTILAAVDGTHRMAPVNSSQDVKAALSLLGGMRVVCGMNDKCWAHVVRSVHSNARHLACLMSF